MFQFSSIAHTHIETQEIVIGKYEGDAVQFKKRIIFEKCDSIKPSRLLKVPIDSVYN